MAAVAFALADLAAFVVAHIERRSQNAHRLVIAFTYSPQSLRKSYAIAIRATGL
jgi:hypothetical protein